MSWVIIEIDGDYTRVEELTLEQKQEIVGGYIEYVKIGSGTMIVNEEGLLHKLPFNTYASIIADRPICGRAIIEEGYKGDEEE
jgi:hypothetical protein